MHTLFPIRLHTLTCIAVIMLQFSSAEGFNIMKSLVKAMCIQTKEFATSNNLQSALNDKKQYANVHDGVCAKVTCTKQGRKCTNINEQKCEPAGAQSIKPRKGGKRSFDGFKVFTLTPKDESQLRSYRQMASVDFWTEPTKVGVPFQVLLSPEQQQKYLNSEVKSRDLIPDIKTLIRNHAKAVRQAPSPGEITWDAYYNLEDIYAFIEKLAKDHPEVAKVITYGESYEKRPLKLISISKSQSGSSSASPSKPIFFMECNIHAREWVSSAVCTYIINELVVGRKECISKYLDQWDFHAIPVANPDGFEFTHKDPGEINAIERRIWRKTRGPTTDPACLGADPNRNFDFHWNNFDFSGLETRDLSNEPCEEIYHGTNASSEIEVLNLSKYLQTPSISERLRIYVAFHAYSQLWLWPYGYTYKEIAEFKFYDEVGRNVTKAIEKRYGKNYTQGPVADTIYPACGTSADYVYGTIFKEKKEPTISGTFELRGTRSDPDGFMLPPEQIIPNALEIIDGLCAILSAIPIQ